MQVTHSSRRLRLTLLCGALLSAFHTNAATPVGAKAEADGNIPAFNGKDVPLAGWEYGKERGDFWKYKDEKPVAAIDSASLSKFSDKLTPGQLTLFKTKPGYRMDVYPTHRNCGIPDFVAANTEKNQGVAKLDAKGENVVDGVFPGVLFSKPKSGAEAIYNYILRYHGVGMYWPTVNTFVSPRPGANNWIYAKSEMWFYMPWAAPGSNRVTSSSQLLQGLLYVVQSPSSLAGQGLVTRTYFNQPTESYYYFTGQRRVRRMPTYLYDAPQIGSENEYLVDESGIFTGPPIDRFNWKLLGQKELYVPYNNFGMYRFNSSIDSVFKSQWVAPENRRYELHRVYVVEATLKADARHVMSKKVFYLDEDTWLPVLAEDYDAQGNLYKVKEGYTIPVWELGGTCDMLPFAQYDMASGRYVTDMSNIGSGKDFRWYEKPSEQWMNSDFFTSQSLQSRSER